VTNWQTFASEAPDLAWAVQERFEAARHHVLATLRRDGSPRVSGTEVDFWGPHLSIGSLWGALKARDLQRDGRFALHANPGDGSMEGGDAKVGGVAVEVDEAALQSYIAERHPPEPLHLFTLDITEVVLTSIKPDGESMWIDSWRPGGGVRRLERRVEYPPRVHSYG
jgi:hypothetical protein